MLLEDMIFLLEQAIVIICPCYEHKQFISMFNVSNFQFAGKLLQTEATWIMSSSCTNAVRRN